MSVFRLAVAGLVLWVAAVAGCSRILDPEPGTNDGFTFTPQTGELAVGAGEYLDFRVVHTSGPDYDVEWRCNGIHAGVGPRYRFIPAATNLDTLVAVATWQGHTARRSWRIDSLHDMPTTVFFTPPDTNFDIVVGDTCHFTVTSGRASRSTWQWHQGDVQVGSGQEYDFVGSAAGTDSIRGTAVTPDRTVSRTWAVRTFAPGTIPPLPPRELLVRNAVAPATVEVSWLPAPARGDPVDRYEVLVSYDGPIDDGNRSAAILLDEVPHNTGQTSYTAVYSDSTAGLLGNRRAWFTIVTVNSAGLRARPPANAEVLITARWWATGRVVDENGQPAAGIPIRDSGYRAFTTSDTAGEFRLGPLTSANSYYLRTETPDVMLPGESSGAWYDAGSGRLSYEGCQTWYPVIVNRTGLTSNCSGYDGGFVELLRGLTRTTQPTNNRPDCRLYKWESYPVTVWVPPFTSVRGFDYQALCRQTVQWWNDLMGADYLTLVDDPATARIVFRFGDDGPGFIGRAYLLEPAGLDYVIGDMIPQKIELYVHEDLYTEQLVQEIALHEMGHGLGMPGHARCSDGDYLMYITAAGALNDGPQNAVHEDEKRVLRTVRNLPQGYDMSQFIIAK